MTASYKNRTHDQRVADDVIVDASSMCPAHGCPCRWTVNGEAGKACTAHYGAPAHEWPAITQRLIDGQVERAIRNTASTTSCEPMTRERRFAILCKLREIGRTPPSPRAWACSLRDRHEAGARLTSWQIAAYRSVLDHDDRRAAAATAQPFDLPPVAPPMPTVELPPVDAYGQEPSA